MIRLLVVPCSSHRCIYAFFYAAHFCFHEVLPRVEASFADVVANDWNLPLSGATAMQVSHANLPPPLNSGCITAFIS